jgi:hypothetical protein
MLRTLNDSVELYRQIKAHFSVNENSSLVVEIDEDKPMDQWKLRIAKTVEGMVQDRSLAAKNPGGFVGFSRFNPEYELGYFDFNVWIVENLHTEKFEFFNTTSANEYEMKMVANDFKGFLSSLA